MAWWPLGRHRREPPADAASPRPAPPPSGLAGSDGAWRDVPVLQPVLVEPLRPVAIGNDDADWLAAHANPSFLAPLTHQVQPWTGGLVEGLLAPGRPVPHGSGVPLEVRRRTRPRPNPALQRSVAVSGPEPPSGRLGPAELDSPDEGSWDGESASEELTTVRLELPPLAEGASPVSGAAVVTSEPQVPEVTVPRPPVAGAEPPPVRPEQSAPVQVAPEQPRPAPRAAPGDPPAEAATRANRAVEPQRSVGRVGSTTDPRLPPSPPPPTDTPPLPVVSRLPQTPTLGQDAVPLASAPRPSTRSPSTRRPAADSDPVPVPPPVQRLHLESPTAIRPAPTTVAGPASTVSAAVRSSATTGPARTHPASPVQSSPVSSKPVSWGTVPLQRSVAPEIPRAPAPVDPPGAPRPAAVPPAAAVPLPAAVTLPVVTPEAWSPERVVATPRPLRTAPATDPGESILVQRRAERPVDPATVAPDPASPPTERRSFTHMFADLDSSVPTAGLRTEGGQLQRQTTEEPVATAPSVDSEPVSSVPVSSAASASVTSPTSSAADPAAGSVDLEEMARRLYEPLSARLRTELWLDRERAGLIGDA